MKRSQVAGLLVLCVAWSAISMATAYSRGAPNFVCSTLTPLHYGITPTTEANGCQLRIQGREQHIVAGQSYDVTITGCNENFKGFMVQCREGSGGDERAFGTFQSASEGVQTVACTGGDQQTAITHTSSTPKPRVSAPWTPSQSCSTQVVCKGTVVFDYTRIVTGLETSIACTAPAGPEPSIEESTTETTAEAEVKTTAEAEIETTAEAEIETTAEAEIETTAEAEIETTAEAEIETTAAVEIETTAEATAEVTRDSDQRCPADRQCAHYNDLGTDSQCCPACKKTISQCANTTCDPVSGCTCDPVPGCTRYAENLVEGECCLRCTKKRAKINMRSPCSYVVCPKGMRCRRINRQAVCTCKDCSDNTSPGDVVYGNDGSPYPSRCHLLRKSCRSCTYLGQ